MLDAGWVRSLEIQGGLVDVNVQLRAYVIHKPMQICFPDELDLALGSANK